MLNIENTQVKDLGPLSKMNNLVTLNASGTPVKSLKPLVQPAKTWRTSSSTTPMCAASHPWRTSLSLKQLKVYNTKVKKRAVESLQQKRLDLNIIYY